ncbi:MAG: cobalamin B12-binding domain-containing protein [Chloroflexi bacterium]|nr:cobalamin B12-binding domain-containing protein [Chloroflexota bacterium]
MRVLLVQPPVPALQVGYSRMIMPEPLALEMVAASVPEHEVRLIDLRVDPDLSAALSTFQPQLVGVTGLTVHVPSMLKICRQTKAELPSAVTVVGGYHASLCPQDLDQPCVDIMVRGEGELTFPELVETLETGGDLARVAGINYRQDGQLVANKWRTPAKKLDSLPLPDHHLSDPFRHQYHFQFWENPYLVETARGCPYRCTFCAVWKFHQGMCRLRAPELVVQELATLPTDMVCFVDDNFWQNLKRSEHLAQLIADAGLRQRYWIQARADSIVRRPRIVEQWARVGLSAALIGFEKFRDDELAGVNKHSSVSINEKAAAIMKANGVDIWGAFIVDPQWTGEDFDALIEYVHKLEIRFPFFTILTPLPGTAFFQEKIHELRTKNFEVYDLLHTVLPTKLPLEEFYTHMARLYASTTLGWAELKRRIKAGVIPPSALRRARAILEQVTDPQAYLVGNRQPV